MNKKIIIGAVISIVAISVVAIGLKVQKQITEPWGRKLTVAQTQRIEIANDNLKQLSTDLEDMKSSHTYPNNNFKKDFSTALHDLITMTNDVNKASESSLSESDADFREIFEKNKHTRQDFIERVSDIEFVITKSDSNTDKDRYNQYVDAVQLLKDAYINNSGYSAEVSERETLSKLLPQIK